MSGYVISIDGEFVEGEGAKISVLDHGFLFGDSIYEVVRTVDGKLFAVDRHLKRLRASAERIALTLPHDDEWFINHLRQMHERRGEGESYLRVVVTRGEGVIDLHPESCLKPCVVGIAKPLNVWPDDHYAQGCKVVLANVRRNPKSATDPAIKSGNYLNNVLALIEARQQGAAEAIMLNVEGHVTEATTSNVFMVKNGVVRTPAMAEGLLEGITRGFILEVCRSLGFVCQEGAISEEEFLAADEAFLTSTTRDVMPIGQVGDKRLEFTPGRVTIKVANAYHEVLRNPENLV